MATVEILPKAPPEAELPSLNSSSEFILNRQRGEFIPALTQYSYNNNAQIQIDINSPTSFVDFSQSYLRFYLQIAGDIQQTSTATVNPDMRMYLAEGGVQALFRNITVSTLNGTELCRLPLANRLQAWFRNVNYSRDYIDKVLWREFDSYEPLPEYERVCIYNWSSFGVIAPDASANVPSSVAQLATLPGGQTGCQFQQDWGTLSVELNTTDQLLVGLTFANTTANTGFAYRDIQVGDEIYWAGFDGTNLGHHISYVLQVVALNASSTHADETKVGAVAGSLLCKIISSSSTGLTAQATPAAYAQNQLYPVTTTLVSGAVVTSSFAVFRYKCAKPMRNYVCVLTNGAIGQYIATNKNVGVISANAYKTAVGGTVLTPGYNPFWTMGSLVTSTNNSTGVNVNANRFVINQNMGGLEVCVQPFHPILMSSVWWPLFLIRGGLRITIDLEKPDYCFVTGSTGIAQNWNYLISNPQYVCDIIQPTQTLTSIYVDLYNNNKLNYHMLGFIQQTDQQQNAGQGNFATRIFPAVRSAVHYICAIQDNRHINTIGTSSVTTPNLSRDPGGDAQYVDSIATGLWSGLSQYQIEIGTERYPLNHPMILDDNSTAYSFNTMAEAWVQLQYALSQLGVSSHVPTLDVSLFSPIPERLNHLWNYMQEGISSNVNTGPNDPNNYQGIVQAQRFYICTSLARHTSPFCGINVKDNAIQPNFYFNQPATNYQWGSNEAVAGAYPLVPANGNVNRYFIQFVSYDAIISIGRDGLIQRR